MTKTKLLIVATHPIQYHAPWYRELAKCQDIHIIVLFGMIPNAAEQSVGFGKEFKWDIPLTDGYESQLLENTSNNPNLSGFGGVDCTDIYQTLKTHKPDAIIITGWHSKLLVRATIAAKRLGIKTIMRGESNAKRARNWKQKLGHRLLLKAFDAFLAIGKSNKQFFINNGVHHEKIFDAPYFIENQRFLESSKISLVQDYNIPSTSYCFVYAGKLIEKKNVQELLSAFSLLYKSHKDIHFLIIGDGELRDELGKNVERQNLPVTFGGFVNQSNLPATYTLGDCFLLGSNYDETWGLVVNEAMVCGLPAIVSSRAGSSDDLIVNSETGFVYQYGDVAELVKNMRYMVEHPAQSKAMGQNAQKHILENYDVNHTVEATRQALSLLTKER